MSVATSLYKTVTHHTALIVLRASRRHHKLKHIKMTAPVPHFLLKALLLLMIASLAVSNARPSHFGDATQVAASEQESNANLLDSGLKPWQLEVIAQRLYEISSQTGGDYNWDKSIRSPEAKRQSRYRQCYFNPISCFRK